jgi:methionyl-tRNA synthetase
MENIKTKILPIEGKRNILITSALPYVNNVPHLGNIIGSVLSADVYVRFCRNRGYNTLFIGGTDEYGTATETAAIKENTTPRAICDKYHQIHSDIYKWFDISFDYHGRTSTAHQEKIVQDIYKKCLKNGYISEEPTVQHFCEKCEKFLADRFIAGKCPACGAPDARGDQCDVCQKTYDALELIDPLCQMPGCGNKPILKSSNHLFLDLNALQPKIEKWFNGENSSELVEKITKSWLKKGLQKRSISRDLKWGVPVPEHKEKVFYVWFDAPIGYISITACYTNSWEKWWKNPENVELYQFMGKDNIPFHTLIFPGSLLATGEKWTMVNGISSTSYLNYEGGKFSKSRNIGIFGDAVKNLDLPNFAWRFYMLLTRPVSGDSDFTWKEFIAKNNGELLATVGNFVNRVLKFVQEKFNSVIPAKTALYTEFTNTIDTEIEKYINHFENRDLKQPLHTAINICALGNKFWQENKPWALLKADFKYCCAVVNIAINLVNCAANLFEPFIPAFSAELFSQINSKITIMDGPVNNSWFAKFELPAGHKIAESIFPIIKKIPETRIEEFRQIFGSHF